MEGVQGANTHVFGQGSATAAPSAFPAPMQPTSTYAPAPTSTIVKVVPLSESDKARLGAYADALGDDFPDL